MSEENNKVLKRLEKQKKKKATICTFLLALVALVIIGCLSIVDIGLLEGILGCLAGLWIGERFQDFYNWLMEDK